MLHSGYNAERQYLKNKMDETMEVGMELIPILKIGWLNGWVLIFFLYLTYGILLRFFPRKVAARLYDRSGRSKRDKVFTYIGSFLAFIYFGLIIFTPLKIGYIIFIPGIVLFVIGLVGFVTALLNFRKAPFDKPATKGLYRVSRHPQQLMFFISFFGICLAIGSWLAIFIQIISSIFFHFRILAEERACLKRYGDSYRAYMKSVPRYFLIKIRVKQGRENIKKD